jgi:hypothetical protein
MSTQKVSAQAEIKELKARMKELEKQVVSQTFADKITVKIGEKGNLLFYGLQKFPVSLYLSQAIRLAKVLNSTEMQEFVAKNADQLAKKEKEEAKVQ